MLTRDVAAVPKIHGLVTRKPRQGDGGRLVQAVLRHHPTVCVGAHPTAVGFYRKLGSVQTADYPSTPSEVAMIYPRAPAESR